MNLEILVHEVKVEGKSVMIEEVLKGDNTPLRNFYIINALGNRMWVKTISRELAQKAVDVLFGENFYTIRSVRGAKGASSPNVRATETRRGQYVQRQKSKILNS